MDWLTARFAEAVRSDGLQVVVRHRRAARAARDDAATTWKGTASRAQCGSGTTPTSNCSSTSTAR